MKKRKILSAEEVDRIVEMAWEDRTTFDAINNQFGVSEKEVIEIMRKTMKTSSFKMWRARVQGRKTKHASKNRKLLTRFKCSRQKSISGNKISKRP
ncbi:TIGR03643 family protein [Belliella kenyensis]|uniref:TIGR03643 family protein n=1 Tax=Belliella kenyensis TaxID=1472724 RepID=A0ABV8EG81_9BACT|nr:TIGR03643 family protein [Belliella kenyensis]MCH7400975.1 TIGR03643 family protein [Belliella kenyensis]MDN3603973.1 TIGR03643 family protein [Belliella kenyensis]